MKSTIALIHVLTTTSPSTASSPSLPADTPPASRTPPGIVIAVEQSSHNADQVRHWLEDSIQQALRSSDTRLAPEDEILIQVDGVTWDYHFMIVATSHDKLVMARMVKCQCNSDDLSKRVATTVVEAATKIVDHKPTKSGSSKQTLVQPEHGPASSATQPDVVAPLPAESTKPVMRPEYAPTSEQLRVQQERQQVELTKEHRKMLNIRTGGLVALSTGLAFLCAGAGMVVVGDRELKANWPHYQRNWRPPGYTVAAIGISGIAAGTTLLLIYDIRCNRNPSTCKSSPRRFKSPERGISHDRRRH